MFLALWLPGGNTSVSFLNAGSCNISWGWGVGGGVQPLKTPNGSVVPLATPGLQASDPPCLCDVVLQLFLWASSV